MALSGTPRQGALLGSDLGIAQQKKRTGALASPSPSPRTMATPRTAKINRNKTTPLPPLPSPGGGGSGEDGSTPLVRAPKNAKSAKSFGGDVRLGNEEWARQVFAKYDHDGHGGKHDRGNADKTGDPHQIPGGVDVSDLQLAFNELRLPVSLEVLQKYVQACADEHEVTLGQYGQHGVPWSDFLKIYRQILAHQPPSVRKMATTKDVKAHRATLQDIRSQENDLRDAFERHVASDLTCSKQGVEEAMNEVGLPDVKGDLYEAFIDFWLLKRTQEGIEQPVDENGQPVFDFQEFILVVNDYHTYVEIRKGLVSEDPDAIFEHQDADRFHSLRMMSTQRKSTSTAGGATPRGKPDIKTQNFPKLSTPRGIR